MKGSAGVGIGIGSFYVFNLLVRTLPALEAAEWGKVVRVLGRDVRLLLLAILWTPTKIVRTPLVLASRTRHPRIGWRSRGGRACYGAARRLLDRSLVS